MQSMTRASSESLKNVREQIARLVVDQVVLVDNLLLALLYNGPVWIKGCQVSRRLESLECLSDVTLIMRGVTAEAVECD